MAEGLEYYKHIKSKLLHSAKEGGKCNFRLQEGPERQVCKDASSDQVQVPALSWMFQERRP